MSQDVGAQLSGSSQVPDNRPVTEKTDAFVPFFAVVSETWNVLNPDEDVGPFVWRLEDCAGNETVGLFASPVNQTFYEIVLTDTFYCSLSLLVWPDGFSEPEKKKYDGRVTEIVKRVRIILQRVIASYDCDTRDSLLLRGDGNFQIKVSDWNAIGNLLATRLQSPMEDDMMTIPASCKFLFLLKKRGSCKILANDTQKFSLIQLDKAKTVLIHVAAEHRMKDHFLFFNNRTNKKRQRPEPTFVGRVGLLAEENTFLFESVPPNENSIIGVRQHSLLFSGLPKSAVGFFEEPSIAQDLYTHFCKKILGMTPNEENFRLTNLILGRLKFFENALSRNLFLQSNQSARATFCWKSSNLEGTDMQSVLQTAIRDAKTFTTNHYWYKEHYFTAVKADTYRKMLQDTIQVLFQTLHHGVAATSKFLKSPNIFTTETILGALKLRNYCSMYVAEAVIAVMLNGHIGKFSKATSVSLPGHNGFNAPVEEWPLDKRFVQVEDGRISTTFIFADLFPDVLRAGRYLFQVLEVYTSLPGLVQEECEDLEGVCTLVFEGLVSILQQGCIRLNHILGPGGLQPRNPLPLLYINACASVGYKYIVYPSQSLQEVLLGRQFWNVPEIDLISNILRFLNDYMDLSTDFETQDALKHAIENEMMEHKKPFVVKLREPKICYVFVPLVGEDLEPIYSQAFHCAFGRDFGSRCIPAKQFMTAFCKYLSERPMPHYLEADTLAKVFHVVNELLDSPLAMKNADFQSLDIKLRDALDIMKENDFRMPEVPQRLVRTEPRDTSGTLNPGRSRHQNSTRNSALEVDGSMQSLPEPSLLANSSRNETNNSNREGSVSVSYSPRNSPEDVFESVRSQQLENRRKQPIRASKKLPTISSLKQEISTPGNILDEDSDSDYQPDMDADESEPEGSIDTNPSRHSKVSQGRAFRACPRVATDTMYDRVNVTRSKFKPPQLARRQTSQAAPKKAFTPAETKAIIHFLITNDFLPYMKSLRTAKLLSVLKVVSRSHWSIHNHVKTVLSKGKLANILDADEFRQIPTVFAGKEPDYELIEQRFNIKKHQLEKERRN